jgi:RNA polymerase sigma-70 factor (ECF subfamily)
MPGSPDETTLLAGLAAGREDAYAAAYDRFAARLLAAAWGMLGNRADAEDAVQDVFVGLVRSRATLAEVEDLGAYLFASLRHAAARRWQGRGAERRQADGADPAAAPQPGAVGGERSERLERALAALPRDQREVVALKIDGGLTFAEIAAVLGVSPNTAASRYRYALQRLRDRLKE